DENRRFDKLCLEQSLDAEPLGGAPRRGESGEGSAARINPSFSAVPQPLIYDRCPAHVLFCPLVACLL
ncbi:MAG: hypothetical protein VW865_13965, partial [Halieaceae bacterium]